MRAKGERFAAVFAPVVSYFSGAHPCWRELSGGRNWSRTFGTRARSTPAAGIQSVALRPASGRASCLRRMPGLWTRISSSLLFLRRKDPDELRQSMIVCTALVEACGIPGRIRVGETCPAWRRCTPSRWWWHIVWPHIVWCSCTIRHSALFTIISPELNLEKLLIYPLALFDHLL